MLFWVVIILCLAFFVHFVWWRVNLPKRQVKVILKIFIGCLILGLFTLWGFSDFIFLWGLYPPTDFFDYLQISLLFVCIMFSYILTFSAIEGDSPSLSIVTAIEKAGPDGLNKDSLEKVIASDFFIKSRVKALITDKMVHLKDDKLVVATKGLFIVLIIIFFRKILNVDKGG